MNDDTLLREILGPVPGGDPLAASLKATLHAVRQRRRVRQARAAGAGIALVLAAIAVGWQGVRTLRSGPDGLATSAPSEPAAPPVPAWVLDTTPMPEAIQVRTRFHQSAQIETRPAVSLEYIGDEQLLALAPGCLALTRSGRGVEVVALCDGLISTP